ncbi:MAG: single-stranded-DNA-specific exonuclease RecJ [Endomicrobiia bacterium]
MPYKWILKENNNIDIELLSEKLNLPKILIKILVNRGYDSEEKIKKFLFNELFYLKNPFLFKDMQKAVETTKKHIEEKNKILIWGDRDVDGVTALSVLLFTLEKLDANVMWYIPQTEGYGLNINTLEKFINEIKLLITVDCGISSFEEIKYLIDKGIDVIVTDHHTPNLEIVQNIKSLNVPVINPHLEEFDFKDLAGVGVALKFCCGLLMSYDEEYYNKEFIVIDLETTGISAVVDEICEIAAVKVKNFVPYEIYTTLIKPTKAIPESVSKIHGITSKLVENAPTIQKVIPELLNFIKNKPLVIHNSDFDLSFLNKSLQNLDYPPLSNKVIDTLKISQEYLPIKSHSLKHLTEHFLFNAKPNHRALNDALATCELFYFLYNIKNHKLKFYIKEMLPLVCLGTISDIVSLTDENRIFVKKGIEEMYNSELPFARRIKKYLLEEKKLSKLDSETFSWQIIPILNSAGRLKKVEIALNLLTAKTYKEANHYFEQLLEIDKQRKNLQEINFSVFYELVEQQCDLEKDLILLVVAENIEHGVTGIVANYMLREFNRCVILLIVENDTAIGAARSPDYVDIYQLLKKCDYLFEKFGGHKNACGITIKKEKIPLFKDELKKLEKEISLKTPEIEIDTEITPEEITLELYQKLNLLEPFGPQNNYPVFLLRNLKVIDWKYFGKTNKYTQIVFETPASTILNAVCWDIPELGDILRNFSYFNVVGELELDPQSKNSLRLTLLDIQPVIHI